MNKKAVVLLSGGADSSTTLACAVRNGFETYALTIDYGQRHRLELELAKKQAAGFSCTRHLILEVDLRAIGKSALTDDIDVPIGRSEEDMADEIPVTYVPARNTIFLSLALGWAESIGTGHIFIGVNAVDYSGYPDCRPEYIDSFEQTARLATKMGVEGNEIRIHTPLIDKTKAEIFRLGTELGVDFSLTLSCYGPADGKPCGKCDSCILRQKGFAEAGLEDPLEYFG